MQQKHLLQDLRRRRPKRMLNSYLRATVLKPVINEKSMRLTEMGQYTFQVDKSVNKDQIAQFVAKKFGVNVLEVKVVNLPTKTKLQRNRRGTFVKSGFRKAIVKVKKGQKIALFEVATPEEEKQDVEVRTAEGEVVAKTKEKRSLLRGTKVKVEKAGAQEEKGKAKA